MPRPLRLKRQPNTASENMINMQELLGKTSRTFALTIPMLPEPCQTDVTLAYLVFRIVDTLEDGENLDLRERCQALEAFEAFLERPSNPLAIKMAARWLEKPPTYQQGDAELLVHMPRVMEELGQRDSSVQKLVRGHARRTAQGMVSFLERDGQRLRSMEELRRYCYFVAGVVGEMLTELFAARVNGFHVDDELRRAAQAFGEGLQLVNILRDSEEDAMHGRCFLGDDIDRSEVFRLARSDLDRAQRFVERLTAANAPAGYIAFSELPLRLAALTLDCVERLGPGAKVSRQEVLQTLQEVASITRHAPSADACFVVEEDEFAGASMS